MQKRQKLSKTSGIEQAIYKDLRFPKSQPGADYDTC